MEGQAVQSTRDPLFRLSLFRIQEAKQKRGTLSESRRQHTCHPRSCQPESERTLQLEAPLACNVFMCTFGSVHVCTQDLCTFYHADQSNTCPISGFQFGQLVSSYIPDDYRTWRAPNAERLYEAPSPAPPVRRYTPQLTAEEVEDRAARMVQLLLYSPQRQQFNEKTMARSRQQADAAKALYVREQRAARQLPFFTDMYRIVAHMTRQTPLREFEADPNYVRYCVFVVRHVWDILQRFHVPLANKRHDLKGVEIVPRLDFDAIALATLYTMRTGARRNHVQLLPADDFLLMNLPIINILGEFGMDKSLVTKGEKLLSEAYDNAFSEGSVMDVVLDVERMPQRERIVEGEAGTLLKISSNGDKLFMPTSRRLPQ